MTVLLARRADITLAAVERVAWLGEGVALAPAAQERMDACRRSFLTLLESEPEMVVYGVTTGAGDRATMRLSRDEQRMHAARPPAVAASFGAALPERVVRAIVLARLANFLEGHAAVSSRVATAVAAMLDGALPTVPAQGNGGAGEVLALTHLFGDLAEQVSLEQKEGMALINGSPCASALVADAALAAQNRLRLACAVFALSIEAFKAPLEAYSEPLDDLWGDEHEAAMLQSLRALLHGSRGGRRWYQAPVSYRIVPRVLGQAHRALAAVEHAAEISLRAVTDNPVYVPPDSEHPLGRVFSTGGYHNGQAPAAIDGLAAAWADLCLLAERHCEKIGLEVASWPADELVVHAPASQRINVFGMVQPAYWEEAKHAAQRTFLARGVWGQNDVVAPSFVAWERERTAGQCLDAALAMLAATASQAFYIIGRAAPPALGALLAEVRELFPPVDDVRVLGADAARLTASFTQRVYSPAGAGEASVSAPQ